MMYFGGMENANSTVKGISNVPGSKPITYRNVLNVVKPTESRENGYLKPGVYEVNGGFYKVGLPYKGASYQSTSSGGDISKYETKEWLVEALIACYKLVEDSEFDFDTDSLTLCLGIPTDHYGIPELQAKLIKRLKGEHKINGKTLDIRVVHVICQSESAFFDVLLLDNGKVNLEMYRKVAQKDWLITDIGFHSCDFVHMQDLIAHSRTFLAGVSECFQNIIDAAFHNDKSLIPSKATPFSLESFLRATGKFEYNNFEFDVEDLREQYFQEYANNLIQHIKNNLDANIYDRILITGGGSALLRKHLEIAIKELNSEGAQRRRFEFTDEAECQMQNARGYLKYALNKSL